MQCHCLEGSTCLINISWLSGESRSLLRVRIKGERDRLTRRETPEGSSPGRLVIGTMALRLDDMTQSNWKKRCQFFYHKKVKNVWDAGYPQYSKLILTQCIKGPTHYPVSQKPCNYYLSTKIDFFFKKRLGLDIRLSALNLEQWPIRTAGHQHTGCSTEPF